MLFRSVKINCTDPYLPMTIIKVPVYGKRCRHIQSFDLETFIRMNGRMKLWNCPHCIEKVFDLEVDTYFEALLSAIQNFSTNIPEIAVDQNGNFKINNEFNVVYETDKFVINKLNDSILFPISTSREHSKPTKNSISLV